VGLLYMSSFSKKVRKTVEKFGDSMSRKKYAKPSNDPKYAKICKLIIDEEQMSDIYPGQSDKVSGTTMTQQDCLQKFAKNRLAELERIKQKKVSEITKTELVELEELKPAIEPRKFKELKTQIEKSKKYLQKIEDGRTKYTGEELVSPLGIQNIRMTKVDTSSVPRSDESDEMFGPKIIIKEPTVQDILDTNGKAYIEWRKSLPKKKGGKSRKNKRGTRRHRKTRR